MLSLDTGSAFNPAASQEIWKASPPTISSELNERVLAALAVLIVKNRHAKRTHAGHLDWKAQIDAEHGRVLPHFSPEDRCIMKGRWFYFQIFDLAFALRHVIDI
jgi:hypothetical protein